MAEADGAVVTIDLSLATARPTMQLRWRITEQFSVPPIKVLEQAWEIVAAKDGQPFVMSVEWREVPHVVGPW